MVLQLNATASLETVKQGIGDVFSLLGSSLQQGEIKSLGHCDGDECEKKGILMERDSALIDVFNCSWSEGHWKEDQGQFID